VETVFESFSGFAETVNRAWFALVVGALVVFAPLLVAAQDQISTSDDGKTMTIQDAPDMEVYAFGKSVIVKQRAKGVLAIGGDITIEGSVSGDVATMGGSIIQTTNGYVGGDVIVIGGTYKPESDTPLREPGKETVMFAVMEDQLRELGQNPSELFSPNLSVSFFALRALSLLFWFIVSFLLTTLAPGAVSRSVARLKLSSLKIAAIGMFALLLTLVGSMLGFQFLPNYLGVSIFFMVFVLLMLAFVFGRVVMNVSIGKLIQKKILPEGNRSETLAVFLGVFFWTLILSIPYLWTFAAIALFVSGLGLVLTAKTPATWRHS
jgi:hypothetical protein